MPPKKYKAKENDMDDMFFEDRSGDFSNFDLAPSIPEYAHDKSNFIPLKPKKGARKKLTKKFHKSKSEEEMEIVKDFMENCDSFDIITPVASNFNYEEDQSDIYSGSSDEESDFQAEAGILEELMGSSESESNEDLIDCLQDDFKYFHFNQQE
jgi:hypothetical protein